MRRRRMTGKKEGEKKEDKDKEKKDREEKEKVEKADGGDKMKDGKKDVGG